MKAIYDKESNTLKEQLEPFIWMDGGKEEYYAKARVIPCSENNWEDGRELEEGKDYEINYSSENKGNGLLAVPIVHETEDELWKEVGQIIIEHFFAGMSLPLSYKLKSKFTIQKRKQ